jgi:hypothetical protein
MHQRPYPLRGYRVHTCFSRRRLAKRGDQSVISSYSACRPSRCVTQGDDVDNGYDWAIELAVSPTLGFNASREKWGLAHADSVDVQLVRDEALCRRAIKATMTKEHWKGARIVLFRVHAIYVVTFADHGDSADVLDRNFRVLDTFVVPS